VTSSTRDPHAGMQLVGKHDVQSEWVDKATNQVDLLLKEKRRKDLFVVCCGVCLSFDDKHKQPSVTNQSISNH